LKLVGRGKSVLASSKYLSECPDVKKLQMMA